MLVLSECFVLGITTRDRFVKRVPHASYGGDSSWLNLQKWLVYVAMSVANGDYENAYK
jgi:hypothetical protein